MRTRRPMNMQLGFSMIEVLVTIIITATGLLGFAKIQAAAISNTQLARVRSLVAMQASSLAASMYGNRAFWAAGLAPSEISAAGGVASDSSGTLAIAADCLHTSCSPTERAAHDVQAWAANLQLQFPGHAATVSCTRPGPLPVHCEIVVAVPEKYVAVNRSSSASAAAMTAVKRFALHVEP